MNLNLSIRSVRSIIDAEFIDSNGLFQDIQIQNIVIDSRSPLININTLFILFNGNKTSGAHYIPEFLKKGGVLVLTDCKLDAENIGQLVVDNPLSALQAIATYHRKKFTIPVIGITGSNGKTTVKEWLYHTLKQDFTIVRSPKSYNSQIGVALSVLEMDERHDLAIFEAGISKSGEMVFLEEMIAPTIGLFTSLGDAHNSGFGTINPTEEKRKEKYILFKGVETLIEWNTDSILVHNSVNTEKFNLNFAEKTVQFLGINKKFEVNTPFSNLASLSNAALVYITADFLKVDRPLIEERFKTLPGISMRLEKIAGKNGNLLINDAYNLDEKSLEIGLQYLNANKEGNKTAIFIAEDSAQINAETSLLNTLKAVKKQIDIHQVIYFGSKKISRHFDFITHQFDAVSDFTKGELEINNTAILFTGSRNCHLETIVNFYTDKKHITRLFINLENIRKNLNLFRERLKNETAILAMVKAQSYGGGILEVAKFLEKENVNYFGVAYADEGVTIRNAGITKSILVMNPEPAAFDDMIDHDLEPSIYSLELLNAFIHQLILRRKTNFPIHIKLDTGMNRLGFRTRELKELLEMLAAQPEVYVKSVFSHLSVADIPTETDFTEEQINNFAQQTELIQGGLGYKFSRHLANSAGAYAYPAAQFEMVRLGIGLFGLLAESQGKGFENVLHFVSQISQTREIKAGESVGYGRSYKAESATRIGIIPVGYADGLRRGLGNGNWQVIIRDKKYPIIGNICMDMCMIDLGTDDLSTGEEVQLFGNGNSVFEMSRILDTIPYEIISSISSRVQRIYLEE